MAGQGQLFVPYDRLLKCTVRVSSAQHLAYHDRMLLSSAWHGEHLPAFPELAALCLLLLCSSAPALPCCWLAGLWTDAPLVLPMRVCACRKAGSTRGVREQALDDALPSLLCSHC